MNQAQRNYLVDKIEKTTNTQVEILKKSLPKQPSLKNHILNMIMSGDVKMKDMEEIQATIKDRVLKSTTDDSWTKANHWSTSATNHISFHFKEIFEIPEEFLKLEAAYKEETDKINEEISKIRGQANTLILRIKLASAKTLQTMIQEVDDMGNLTLMDTKLKELPGM